MFRVLTESDTYGKMLLPAGQNSPPILNLEVASVAYSKLRDDVNEGCSTFRDGFVFNETGEYLYRISYNGKVWTRYIGEGFEETLIYNPFDKGKS